MAQESVTIQIEGMTCGHCVHAVKSAVEELDGVSHAEVSLEDKSAVITYDPDWIDTGEIADIIEEEGYTASLS